MTMRVTDMWTGSTYTAPGGRAYFIESICGDSGARIVEYSVIEGLETGKRLTAPLDEFARRVTARLPENQDTTGGRS